MKDKEFKITLIYEKMNIRNRIRKKEMWRERMGGGRRISSVTK